MPKPAVTALDRALRLLAARARTAAELERALARAGHPDEERASAMARLRELGYMDDATVAEGRARTLLASGVAPRLTTRRLLSQGVAAPTARAAIEAAAEGADEEALVARAVEKALRGREPRGDEERHRLLRRLVGKGHRPSLVAKALGLGDDFADDDRGNDGVEE